MNLYHIFHGIYNFSIYVLSTSIKIYWKYDFYTLVSNFQNRRLVIILSLQLGPSTINSICPVMCLIESWLKCVDSMWNAPQPTTSISFSWIPNFYLSHNKNLPLFLIMDHSFSLKLYLSSSWRIINMHQDSFSFNLQNFKLTNQNL